MNKEEKTALARIIVSAALLVAVWLSPVEGVLRLALFLIPYFIVGYEVLFTAGRNILHGEVFDENFLMALATIGAFATGEYPEAVAVMLFYQVGELFEDIAVGRSRKSIAALMDIRPDHANVLRGGEEVTVSPADVAVGETIIVKPGERVPLDGMIIEGHTSLDTSALTGESAPRDRAAGENVVSGSVNLSALIKVRVSSEYGESTVAKILDLVENSAEKKAKSENFITRFARYYTPIVVISALLLAVLPPLFFAKPFTEWLNRALIFLMVSCPCALVVSVPLSFFAGIGGASKRGILIKGSNYLEALSNVGTVVFDKTGTLTRGSFEVSAIHPQEMSEAELLDVAALAESYSNHPIAASIVRAHGGHIDKARVSDITELAGLGVCAEIDGAKVYAGNGKLMDKVGAAWHECHRTGTIVHIAKQDEYLGHIVISDEVKPDSAAAIAALKSLGVRKTVMLTGDMRKVGEAVGSELNIDDVRAELLPDQKVQAVEELLAGNASNGKATLAFVGDGVNDAPVLTRADVGIAMGALGSDAAIEAADIVLMDDKPSKIADAIAISRRTMRIVRQNIVFALSIKALLLVFSALGITDMWVAVFADVGVLILAILNAMRALRFTQVEIPRK